MLKSLSIKNFAIIKNIDINFESKFNVIVGETGAGKSMVLDALNFVLGGKSNKDNIRHNEQSMSVRAVFENYNKNTANILSEYDIEQEDVLIISRSFNQEGKSSCLVNGQSVTVSMLKNIAETLLDFYGQHENVELLKVKNHIQMLDACDVSIENLKDEVYKKIKLKNDITSQIQSLGGDESNRERMIDLLNFQIKEIESAQIKQDEEDELKYQLSLMQNSEKIVESVSGAVNALKQSNLSIVSQLIENASAHDESLKELKSRAKSAIIELEDVCDSLSDYVSSLNFSESDMDKIDSRLDVIKSIKKKYGQSLEHVNSYLEKIKVDYDNLVNCEDKMNELNDNLKNVNKELFDLSKQLRGKRLLVSNKIQTLIEKELSSLGMKNARFVVKFNDIPTSPDFNYTKNGFDEVEFLWSANLGEELKSLAKTISGGEMSRFMLAVKNVLANPDSVSTLVFDEIDSGISGETGLMVAQKMANLSQSYQLLCISHMQQVTAMADKYIFIEKKSDNCETISQAKEIDGDDVISYIAGMTGMKQSETAINTAKELKNISDLYKANLNK